MLDRHHPLGAGQAFGLAIGICVERVLHGVMTFGNPISNQAAKCFGLRQCDVLELRKMWVDDTLPKNTESRALAIAARLLRKQYPQIRLLLTYCDGDEVATAYKAAGWVPLMAHEYDREYLVDGVWMSARDANRKGLRARATDVKRENRRKWAIGLTEEGRQLIETAKSKMPRRPETGVGSSSTRGLARTQANSEAGST